MPTTHKTKRMREVEAEFGDDIREVIQDLREVGGGNPWRIVAGCLGISMMALYSWRRGLGLPLTGEQVHLSEEPKPHSLDHRAVAIGYASAEDAIREMRLGNELPVREVASRLGCCVQSVSRRTPAGVSVLANRRDLERRRDAQGRFARGIW